MTDLIRLDGYLPVLVAGRAGACQEISLEALIVDLRDGAPPPTGAVALELLCSDSLTVRATAEVRGAQGDDRLQRLDLQITGFDGDGRAQLVGHVSSMRKASHLGIAATEEVEAAVTRAGRHTVQLPHVALPEAHPDELDLSVTLLGKRLAAPLLIAGITGGSERAGRVNKRLAAAAQQLGLGMGLGSQRAMLEMPSLVDSFRVRDVAPDILLLGNVGAVQLGLGVGVEDCRRLVDAVQADALAVHLNPLQELVQPEGDRDWRGLLARIGALCSALEVPVVVKETGCGISGELAVRLRDAGVAAIDVGGAGGTSWGWIEGFRSASPQRQAIGATFREWGIPTVDALRSCRAALGADYPLIATGGVRSGLDIARAIATGADVAGMALPFFRAADTSADAALDLGRRLIEEVRIATLLTGASSSQDLRGRVR